MTIKEIQNRLKQYPLSIVAMHTGISYQQLWRLRKGIDENPTLKTIEKLSNYLGSQHVA